VGQPRQIDKPVPLELIPVWMVSYSCLRVAATVTLATATVSG
jgi:hypothetical protein